MSEKRGIRGGGKRRQNLEMNSQICYVLLFDIVKGSRVKKKKKAGSLAGRLGNGCN